MGDVSKNRGENVCLYRFEKLYYNVIKWDTWEWEIVFLFFLSGEVSVKYLLREQGCC
jgi:hypothetical protein